MYGNKGACLTWSPRWVLTGCLIAFGFAPANASPSHSAEISGSELNPKERLDAELRLERKLRECIASQQRIDGQYGNPSVRVRFQPGGERLSVDIGPGFVPPEPTQSFREQLAELNELIYWDMDLIARVEWEFRFDGKDIGAYHVLSADELLRGMPFGSDPCANRVLPRKS